MQLLKDVCDLGNGWCSGVMQPVGLSECVNGEGTVPVVVDVGHIQRGFEHGSEGQAEEVNVTELETRRHSADVNLE